ncbi:MAG: acyltransferase family protein [Candidatus Nanopelagicales bacterium]
MARIDSGVDRGVSGARQHSIGYRASLDGVRGCAIAIILVYHGSSTLLGGGFLGVDIFFVLSGFLITSILLHEWHSTGRLNLRDFWLARARRLLPALMVVLVVILLASALVAGRAGNAMRTDSVATFFYASNWWFIAEGTSYFDQFSNPSPLRHTWSLAIEEQWYLLFPLFLLGILSWFKGRRFLAGLLLAGAVASAGLMAYLAAKPDGQSRAYYGTDTRVQALLVGAALAALLTPGVLMRLARFAQPIGVLGAAAAIALLLLVDETQQWAYRGGFLLCAIAIAAVIVSVTAHPDGWLARGLSWRPLVWLGKISYGVYLWHWPIYLFLTPEHVDLSGLPLFAVRVALTLGTAQLSYTYLEMPIRRGALSRMSVPTRRTLLVATPVAVVAVTLTAFGLAKPPASDSLETLAAKATAAPSLSLTPVSRSKRGPTTAVLVGDSNALSLFAAYTPNLIRNLSVAPGTEFGCGVAPFTASINGEPMTVPNKCWQWVRSNRNKQIRAANANLGVLFAGSWEQYDRWIDGAAVSFTDERWQTATQRAYEEIIALLHKKVGSVAVVLSGCNNVSDSDLPTATAFEAGHYPPIVNDARRTAAVNRAATLAAQSMPYDVPVVDLHAHLCASGFQESRGGVVMRTDGLHYTTKGGQLVWRWLGPELIRARTEAP